MIFIDRYRKDVIPPEVLTNPTMAGPRETADAILYFGGHPPRNMEEPDFKAYKDDSVKAALNKLFHGKCAYCESHYASTAPMDVEHWRPKGAVDTEGKKKVKPGYYWLAAAWENLLPSCIYCNRANYHLQGLDSETLVKSGKQNLFPLTEESKRQRRHDEPNREQPLLLNPCQDSPEQHLHFPNDPNKNELDGIVQPRENEPGEPSPRGQTSIDVYGLNRKGLVDERRARFLLIKQQIKRVNDLLQDLEEAETETTRQKLSTRLDEELEILKRYKDEDQPYAQMARQVINAFLDTKTGSQPR